MLLKAVTPSFTQERFSDGNNKNKDRNNQYKVLGVNVCYKTNTGEKKIKIGENRSCEATVKLSDVR